MRMDGRLGVDWMEDDATGLEFGPLSAVLIPGARFSRETHLTLDSGKGGTAAKGFPRTSSGQAPRRLTRIADPDETPCMWQKMR